MDREGERGNVEIPRFMRRGSNAGKMKELIILHNIGDPSSLLAFALNELLLFCVSVISLSFVLHAGTNLRVTKRWPLQHDKDHTRLWLCCSISFKNANYLG
jgi:hypothetical protein